MEISENQIFEALGVTNTPESGKTPETADPAAAGSEDVQTATGAKEQEPAAPAVSSEKTGKEQPATDDDGADGKDTALTPEQRKENAAQRRRQERDAAIAEAVNQALQTEREKTDAEWKAFFEKAKLKNTLTGKPITTREDFDKWSADFEAARLQQQLKTGKLTPETLNQFIEQNPAVKKAKELAAQQDSVQAQAKIDAEIAEIHKQDPTINSVQDLVSMPDAQKFYDYVRKGNSFLDAWYLTRRTAEAAQIAEAAKQQTMNSARSKDHLVATGASRGAGAESVPAEEMRYFKLFNPDVSDQDIQAYYNKTRK